MTPISTRIYPFLLTLLLPVLAFGAKQQDIVVYSDIKGQFEDYNPDLQTISNNAIGSLQRFKVIRQSNSAVNARSPLKDRIIEARKDNILWLADVTMTSEKKDATLRVVIYDTFKGESVFRFKEDYDADNIKALLAQLEYQLPIELKNRFLELGRVIKNENRLAYIDLGETAGVVVGDLFLAFEEGDEIEDVDGNSFGYLQDNQGVIKITNVNSVYSIGEILIGELAIKPKQLVKKIENAKEQDYRAEILSVLENQVAVNIGKNVGVKTGSYYSIYRDIKNIKDNAAFRTPIGHIKINEVYDDYAKGELSISDSFNLTKYTIQKGDRIQEAESPRKNMWSFNQLITSVGTNDSQQILYGSYQRDSSVSVDMVYRFKGGINTHQEPFTAFGVMRSLQRSSHVFLGIDAVYLTKTAIDLYLSVDIDTPLSRHLKINLETGYIITEAVPGLSGLNTSVGLKYALGTF